MRKILNLVIVFVVIAAFQGCYYDKAELVYPTSGCDTVNMKYTTTIQSIIQSNCNVCHAGTASGANGIKLDSYTELKAKATSGILLNRITSTDPSIMMPKGGPRLSDCDINKFRAWINNGTPD